MERERECFQTFSGDVELLSITVPTVHPKISFNRPREATMEGRTALDLRGQVVPLRIVMRRHKLEPVIADPCSAFELPQCDSVDRMK